MVGTLPFGLLFCPCSELAPLRDSPLSCARAARPRACTISRTTTCESDLSRQRESYGVTDRVVPSPQLKGAGPSSDGDFVDDLMLIACPVSLRCMLCDVCDGEKMCESRRARHDRRGASGAAGDRTDAPLEVRCVPAVYSAILHSQNSISPRSQFHAHAPQLQPTASATRPARSRAAPQPSEPLHAADAKTCHDRALHANNRRSSSTPRIPARTCGGGYCAAACASPSCLL